MAKFARVGYGHDGRGMGKFENEQGYLYVVNDNVRKGAVLQVLATSTTPIGGTRVSTGKKFITTGKVNTSPVNELSAKGLDAKTELQEKGIDPTTAKTGAELGVSKSLIPQLQKQEHLSQYGYVTRAKMVQQYAQENPNVQFTGNTEKLLDVNTEKYTKSIVNKNKDTFDSYSKKYMKQGD